MSERLLRASLAVQKDKSKEHTLFEFKVVMRRKMDLELVLDKQRQVTRRALSPNILFGQQRHPPHLQHRNCLLPMTCSSAFWFFGQR